MCNYHVKEKNVKCWRNLLYILLYTVIGVNVDLSAGDIMPEAINSCQ